MRTLRRILKRYAPSAKAALWRRLMSGTKFIAVTGSLGKTTATECLGTMLSAHAPTNWRSGGGNDWKSLAAILQATRREHRYTLLEAGLSRPGVLRRFAWMVDPDIAIVLAVKPVHSHHFPDPDEIAHEKSQILSRLGRSDIAVLNRDDPRVWAMRTGCKGRVLSFGLKPGCDLSASEIDARFPAPLRFRATLGSESCMVETNLIGKLWVTSVLGALLGAVAAGVPLQTAAKALKDVQPVRSRMTPFQLPNGAWLLRDDFNPTFSSLDAALEVLRTAHADRRIFVGGEHYDGPDTDLGVKRELGRRVGGSADLAVFIGRKMGPASKSALDAGIVAGSAVNFHHFPQAVEFLRQELRKGDVVLLRGAINRHLERIFFMLTGEIECSLTWCDLNKYCKSCKNLGFHPHPDLADLMVTRQQSTPAGQSSGKAETERNLR